MMKVILNRLKPQSEEVITEEQDRFKAEMKMTATEQRHLKNLFEKVSSQLAGSVPGVLMVLKSRLTGC